MSDERPRGVPDWFVTFADLMALLLTFFLMLLSCSEMKSEEKYQALMNSFQQQFGRADHHARVPPGELRPRSMLLAKLSKTKLAGRNDAMSLASRATEIRNGETDEQTAVVELRHDQLEIDAAQLSEIQELAVAARRHGGKLVIRFSEPTAPVAKIAIRPGTSATR